MHRFNYLVVNVMKKVLVILMGILLFGGLFYWFQWRPSEIRKECDQIAWSRLKEYNETLDWYDYKYTQCLHSKGLK